MAPILSNFARSTSTHTRSVSLALALSVFSPALESLVHDNSAFAQPNRPRPTRRTSRVTVSYSTSTNPFEANERITQIATDAFNSSTSDRVRLENLIAQLRVRGPAGLLFRDDRNPQTAIQTIERGGGDCSSLMNLAVSGILVMNSLGAGIEGGVYSIHFNSSQNTIDHAVPYVIVDGAPMLFDLQLGRIVASYSESHSILQTYPDFPSARSIYHREMGDWLSDRNRYADSISAYTIAVSFFPNDPYVLSNLAASYNNSGDIPAAVRAYEQAAALDPSEASHLPMAYRNLCLYYDRLARAAFGRRDWTVAEENYAHSRDVINQYHPYSPEVEAQKLSNLEHNISACQHNAQLQNARP
ncbi:tetratricopeptide repeat protein [Candidatus Micrarchaeota archaeon]|nr:tetratricopeptide repeat protein [Candidatus Micrarchaeota archaeon]